MNNQATYVKKNLLQNVAMQKSKSLDFTALAAARDHIW